MARLTEAVEVRDEVVRALRLDLVGPWAGHPLTDERLPGWVRPSNWYLTGFLAPRGAPADQRADADVDDEPEAAESAGLGGDSTEDRRAAKKGFFPSSLGLSFLVGEEVEALEAVVRWGDYRRVEGEDQGEGEGEGRIDPADRSHDEEASGETGTTREEQAATAGESGEEAPDESGGTSTAATSAPDPRTAEAGETGARTTWRWQRTPREEAVRVVLPAAAGARSPLQVPHSGGPHPPHRRPPGGRRELRGPHRPRNACGQNRPALRPGSRRLASAPSTSEVDHEALDYPIRHSGGYLHSSLHGRTPLPA